MQKWLCIPIILLVVTSCLNEDQIVFPVEQPDNSNFNRPLPNEILDISPPGFCWWRAAPVGSVHYQLRVQTTEGEHVYTSELLEDPVHVPGQVFSAGNYIWEVDALDTSGKILATRGAEKFTIGEEALELPWIEPGELLSRVPLDHPRLLFLKTQMPEIHRTLNNSRSSAYKDLRIIADQALELGLMPKPDFDKYDRDTEYAMRRTAYRASYREFTRVYHRGMIPLALMYLLSGEEKYGLAAKKHLLNVLDWELNGVASLERNFDEVGLRIARTAAQGYDWLFDLFSESERKAVKEMLLLRGDQMFERLQERDFLFRSAYSHDGRLPGYLVEFAIALAEEARAQVWLDYAMKALLTVFPHWGGKDGGWAEGINYVLSYNDRFITPLQSLYVATGYDLWKKSYFRKMRHFLMYCISPFGEITPFGDSEHLSIRNRAGDLHSVLLFHALRYHDPATRWWIELLEADRGNTQRLEAMNRIILPDDLKPSQPESLAPDKAFHGVGWAALHSNILDPAKDLMCLFKSSPYGPVSHSHADQNSFAILKGGKALVQPSGARYPQHQSPFHFQYTNLTVAHNALLINGEGQIDRDASAHGQLVDFQSTPHLGYVAGDAQKCYTNQLDYYVRHMLLVRPSVVLVIDDLSGSESFTVDWLMHGREKMLLDADRQLIESFRFEEAMRTKVVTPGGFDFTLTNEWPIDPKQDYPMVTAEPPAPEWHFTATTSENTHQRRIAAIMLVKENGKYPECEVTVQSDRIKVSGQFGDDSWTGTIGVGTEQYAKGPLLEITYRPGDGEVERLSISGME